MWTLCETTTFLYPLRVYLDYYKIFSVWSPQWMPNTSILLKEGCIFVLPDPELIVGASVPISYNSLEQDKRSLKGKFIGWCTPSLEDINRLLATNLLFVTTTCYPLCATSPLGIFYQHDNVLRPTRTYSV